MSIRKSGIFELGQRLIWPQTVAAYNAAHTVQTAERTVCGADSAGYADGKVQKRSVNKGVHARNLMLIFSKVLQEMHASSKNFLPSLVLYFDGEKDPRDLMVVFSFLHAIMVEWDVAEDAQV